VPGHVPNKLDSEKGVDFQQLADLPLFQGLPQDELQVLAGLLCITELPADTLLFREGDLGDHFYIIFSGEVEVLKSLGTEGEWLVAVLGPGEFLGDLSLLNPDRLRTASVRSRGPVTLWEMHHEDIDGLLDRQPRVAFKLVSTLGARLTQMDNAVIASLRAKNIELTQAYEALQSAQEQLVEKERLEQELRVAYQIQVSILPQKLPELPGFKFGARIVPARTVGGDFFDFIPLGDNRVGIVIGDVADKGIPAAIFMARAHALLYAEVFQCPTPAEALRRVNQHLHQINTPNLFVTVLYGVLDRRTGRFTYARAGHELPILFPPGEQPARVNHDLGQLLGILEEPVFDEKTIQIPPGGSLLLYTDGLVDGINPQGQRFGYQQLLEEADRWRALPAQELCDRLLDRVLTYQGDVHLQDDVTLVAISSVTDGKEDV
jgi:serine phosphatase RsbU (regulator of sigma subunit)